MGSMFKSAGLGIGVSTFAFGLLWAWLLRRPLEGGARIQWIVSVPLAMANAGVSFAFLTYVTEARYSIERLLTSLTIGAIVGAFVWVPALGLTLLLLSWPIAHAQALATKGLTGRENGDALVCATCTVLACCALVFSGVGGETPGSTFAAVTSVLGGAVGGAGVLLSTLRQRARARFVASVERDDYRIEPTADGNVLVRVMPQTGAVYRIATSSEEVCWLDQEGNATDSRVVRG